MTADSICPDPHELFKGGEQLRADAEASDQTVFVTDFRIAVARADCVEMIAPFSGLRRLELHLETGQPAQLALIPDMGGPQLLTIMPDQYEALGRVLAAVFERLAHIPPADVVKVQAPSSSPSLARLLDAIRDRFGDRPRGVSLGDPINPEPSPAEAWPR